jgi:hypothetical protein
MLTAALARGVFVSGRPIGQGRRSPQPRRCGRAGTRASRVQLVCFRRMTSPPRSASSMQPNPMQLVSHPIGSRPTSSGWAELLGPGGCSRLPTSSQGQSLDLPQFPGLALDACPFWPEGAVGLRLTSKTSPASDWTATGAGMPRLPYWWANLTLLGKPLSIPSWSFARAYRGLKPLWTSQRRPLVVT